MGERRGWEIGVGLSISQSFNDPLLPTVNRGSQIGADSPHCEVHHILSRKKAWQPRSIVNGSSFFLPRNISLKLD